MSLRMWGCLSGCEMSVRMWDVCEDVGMSVRDVGCL